MGLFDLFAKGKDVGSGIKEASEGIGSGVSNIITTIKDKVPPQLRGEIEKLDIEINGRIQELKIDSENRMRDILQKSDEVFRDFALKYEGSADQVPGWILVIRSLIRPVITIFYFAWLMIFMTFDFIRIIKLYNGGKEITPDIFILNMLPTSFWVILGIILGFWFGGRAGENIVDKFKRKRD